MKNNHWGEALEAVIGVILIVVVVISLVELVEAVIERMQTPTEVKSEGTADIGSRIGHWHAGGVRGYFD